LALGLVSAGVKIVAFVGRKDFPSFARVVSSTPNTI
jgi:hypothetical protein